jgi:hypothetical protein
MTNTVTYYENPQFKDKKKFHNIGPWSSRNGTHLQPFSVGVEQRDRISVIRIEIPTGGDAVRILVGIVGERS